MRGALRVLDLWAITAALLCAQSRFPMCYLDEVGHLDGLDKRKFADLGFVRVFPEPDGMLRIEGEDDAGKPWRVRMPPGPGITDTDVWSADFDHNGRKDLLVAAYQFPNGRCIDLVDLTFLVFDTQGRPVPWRMPNHYLSQRRGDHFVPAILLNANHDGRAELVTTGCEYSDPADQSRFGEDRRITGIYEARDAHWVPLRDAKLAGYQRAAENTDRRRNAKWLPPDPPDQWLDQLRGIDAPAVKLLRLIPLDPACRGVNIPIENGRAAPRPKPDPCDQAKYNRATYSDGATPRRWPPVVIDSSAGREIYVPANEPDAEILQRIMREGWPLKRLGNPAAPDWLWIAGKPGT